MLPRIDPPEEEEEYVPPPADDICDGEDITDDEAIEKGCVEAISEENLPSDANL